MDNNEISARTAALILFPVDSDSDSEHLCITTISPYTRPFNRNHKKTMNYTRQLLIQIYKNQTVFSQAMETPIKA